MKPFDEVHARMAEMTTEELADLIGVLERPKAEALTRLVRLGVGDLARLGKNGED